MTSYTSEEGLRPYKVKLKASDLPLSSATRAAIEGLAHTFKKKGGYDSLRKQIWDDLMKTSFETKLTESLVKAAEIELEKNDYDLLKKSRSAAQALIHGAVERAGVYCDAEQQIDALIDSHIAEIENGIRNIRKNDVGEEIAAAEFARGGKTDEQYAEEARQKREAREKLKNDAKLKELAAIEEKQREEQKKAQAELEKRTIEREARRKAEREREEKKERDLRERQRREREKKDQEREEREKEELHRKEQERKEQERKEQEKKEQVRRDQERKEKEKEQKEQKGREQEDRHRGLKKDTKDSLSGSKEIKEANSTKPILSIEEIESLELEALNHLLKPTITRTKPKLDLDIDDTLAPPPRKLIPSSAIQPISRASPMRLDIKKTLNPLKIELRSKAITLSSKVSMKDDRCSRDRSPDRNITRKTSKSRSRSRSRSRHRDRNRIRVSKDRELKSSRRNSREQLRNERSRNGLQECEENHRDKPCRRHSKDIEDHYRHEQKKRHRSDSIESTFTEYNKTKIPKSEERDSLTIRRESHLKGEERMISPVINKKFNYTRNKNRDIYARSRSRTPPKSKRRIERSLSPPNIDRYVPGAHGRRRRDSKSLRSPTRRKHRSRSRSRDRSRDRSRGRSKDRSRSRDRDRERDKVNKYFRDEQKSHRLSRSDSYDRQSRQRDKSRDRERAKARSRSRSPYFRRERDKRRERSKSRDRDGYRERDRDRDRNRDRNQDRDKESGHGREKKKFRSLSRERNREKPRNRNRSRSRSSIGNRRDC
ncbi:putative arginine rich protein [Erysiphe necator]|uniref:Putative arginine rich protein n=1 Tax=Uncinula necator TaxID=52586 RepID=A0A0B1P2C2_UNCNE|nr:putative arginine rich protein [Erysiphe necator]